MHDFARALGFANLAAGMLLLLFPNVARRTIEARAEYARLSDNSLRLLGSWMLMMGIALVGIAVRRGAGEIAGAITVPPRRIVA